MARKNYCKILGVSRDADEKTVKKAYRNLAMKYHPDRNPGQEREANQKFKEINEAYEVLGDPDKRRQYDMFGTVGTGDIFGSSFTRTGFEEAMRDFERGGLGFDFLKNVFDGFEFFSRPDGVEFRTPRPGGRVFRSRVSLEDMLGDLFGERTGRGRQYSETPFGDVFRQQKGTRNDIHEQLSLSSQKASRGIKMEYKRGGGNIEITIPPGVRSGERIIYKGARLKLDGQHGDLYVHVKVRD